MGDDDRVSTFDEVAPPHSVVFMTKKSQARRPPEIPAVAARRSALPNALDSLTTAHPRGRPSKFGRAARAVTVTLPDDVIERLATINPDISRAIVQLAETLAARAHTLPAPVEISEYGQGALIVVSPVNALRELPGVELIPLSDGRALISLDTPVTLSQLELGIRDALDTGTHAEADREALEGVATILRRARQSSQTTLRTRTIIVVGAKRRSRKHTR